MNDIKHGSVPRADPVTGPDAPTGAVPVRLTRKASRWYALPGFAILVACLLLGEALKARLALILPGNILGLFLLLGLLGAGAVPLRWVEGAARWLLWLLPLLFVPIFVLALRDKVFWSARGPTLVAVMFVATVFLWGACGHLAQWLLRAERKIHVAGEHAFFPGLLMMDIHHAPPLADVLALVLWSGLTIAMYALCRWVFVRSRISLLFPGVTAIAGMLILVVVTGHPFEDYARETAWINWLLGPAVVALAVPIYELRGVVRANLRVLGIAIPASLGIAAGSTMFLLAAAGRPRAEVAAGALKSITSPVAYRLAVDASVPLAVVMAGVLIAGTLGATIGPATLRWMRVRDTRAVGLALGCTSHGIGVAAALGISETAGTFASLGMTGTAMCAALVMPYLLRWVLGAG
jgi:putative effector of murein hydrolase/putative effector of murein hydrolase LrgA (UPF0299 family)